MNVSVKELVLKMFPERFLSLFLMVQFHPLVYCSQNQHALLTNISVPCLHPWTLPLRSDENTTVKCECGDSIQGVIKCNPISFKLAVLYCYCLTYSDILDTTVVGYCLTSCHGKHTATSIHIQNTSDLNNAMCGDLHRTGQMCGRCKEGYALPVYSYSLACVECSDYKYNWLKFIAVAFLPLTLFYVLVVVFRISAFSGNLNATILVFQLLTLSAILRYCQHTLSDMPKVAVVLMQCFMTAYSVWNLDFFRTLYTPFCLHPKLTTLQALALDYAVAVYPILLIMLTYLCVMLHDQYRIVIWLWSPFHRCLSYFRKEWHIRRSLVDVFATFLLLSYVKILDVSFNILSPTTLWNINGKRLKDLFLYFDGTVKYFEEDHIPFAVFAIGMLCTFNILPLLLLVVYPCRCFQRCLNHCHCQCQILRVFMDIFQGRFKTSPYDCRYFAAFYLLLRFINLVIMEWTKSALYFPLSGLLLGFASMTVAIVRPWSCWWYNILDSLLLASLSVTGTLFYTIALSAQYVDPNHSSSFFLRGISGSLAAVPGIFGIVLMIYSLTPKAVLGCCKQRARAGFRKLCCGNEGRNESTPLIGCDNM